MDDARRLAYLDAIGITRYVPRRPLPGAKLSPVASDAPDVSDREIAPSLVTLAPEPPHPAHTAPAPPTPVPEHRRAQPAVPAGVYHCQLAIWQVDELLVLADAPQLDNAQLGLLRNLLRALGRPDTLPDVHQFHWPLPQRKDKSLEAARDHFQGMLDGGFLQDTRIRHILSLGSAAMLLLGEETKDAPALPGYRDWPITTIASLQEMLQEPDSKRDAWARLQPLVRL